MKPGTKVLTKLDSRTTGWSEETIQNRRDNAPGEVVSHHNSHGEVYSVKHRDGVVTYYEPHELIAVPPKPPVLIDSRGRDFTVGDEVVYLPKIVVTPDYHGTSVEINQPGMRVVKVARIDRREDIGETIDVVLDNGVILTGDSENGGWGCLKLEQVAKPAEPPFRKREPELLEFGGQRHQ